MNIPPIPHGVPRALKLLFGGAAMGYFIYAFPRSAEAAMRRLSRQKNDKAEPRAMHID